MNVRLCSVVLLSLAIVGCSYIHGPVKEVEAYGAAIEPFIAELSKTVAAEPSEADVNKAVKLWESKKADLKAKRDAIDAAPQGKNVDWQSLLWKINDRIRDSLNGIGGALPYDSPEDKKFEQLQSEIETTLKLK